MAISSATETLKLSDITAKVRIMLDEIATNASEFDSGEDETKLEEIIEDKALEALRFVNGNADVSLLIPDEFYNLSPSSIAVEGTPWLQETENFVGNYTVGTIIFPVDFLRLIYAGYSDWPRYLDDYVLRNEPEWAKLTNKYTTGTFERPKLGMETIDGGLKKLYLFSRTSSTLTTITADVAYMVIPEWTTSGDEKALKVSRFAEDGFFYYLTGLVLTVLGDERQQNMYDQAALLLGIHKNTTEA